MQTQAKIPTVILPAVSDDETGNRRARQMTRTLLKAIFLTLFSQTAWANKCVLNGNAAAEITAQNSCKNGLTADTAAHEGQKLQELLHQKDKMNAQNAGF